MEEKRDLYFQHQDETCSLLLKDCTRYEAGKKIANFLHEHGYMAPYIRSWDENGVMTFDAGSHSEFFYWAIDGALNKTIRKR